MTLPNPKNTGKQTMPKNVRPKLRDCPFCHSNGADDEKIHFIGNLNIYNGGEYIASYTIFCTGCGVELHDEYEDEVIRLWNGELKEANDA